MTDSIAAPTPYEVLGVPASVSPSDLRVAYRRMLRLTHPDTGGDPAQFLAVQSAWERVGDEEARAAYDRGYTLPGSGDAAGCARRAPGGGSALRARSFGVAGGLARDEYARLVADWGGAAGRNPLDPAVVRSAPPELRAVLAMALAQEETEQLVLHLGMGYIAWHEVAVTGAEPLNHVVLGPSGLYGLRSADWGRGVSVVRGDVAGEGISVDEHPLADLARQCGLLGRSLGVRFTAPVLVVPDAALAEPIVMITHGPRAGAIVVRRSLLPRVLRDGVHGAERVSIGRVYDLRTRLLAGLRTL
ncbi:hypothetical protein GCM10022198_11940 [Klugiella xanthotipulae]|uniref:DnaJ-like protein n=1 Tax=Klugiella xanthotipulae TaxID=244735 RepID=A0A543I4P8_9MICO|nr:DnaJ domain-containing protein [Klugiella xanthotipulae]TQM65565.1 DnaJ-like protein [Klugiella xanthotipulae]